MSVLTVASGQSVSRGYDYFLEKKVKYIEQMDETVIYGEISGSNGEVYHATVDIAHPRKSKCDCPHASGRRIVCKHMVAVYFTALPGEADKYVRELEAYWEEEEQRQEELEEMLIRYVHSLKKSELQEKLLEVLYDLPDWRFERFVRDNLDY